jgi:hypothetical protein
MNFQEARDYLNTIVNEREAAMHMTQLLEALEHAQQQTAAAQKDGLK